MLLIKSIALAKRKIISQKVQSISRQE